jgi:hypothetical protein
MISLPLLKRLLPLPALVKLMWSTPRRPLGQPDERVAGIVARVGRISRGNCLDRSLIVYRLLSQGGADPTLVIGFGRQADVIGHTWVTVGGRPLLENGDSLAAYTEFLAFGANGAQTAGR